MELFPVSTKDSTIYIDLSKVVSIESKFIAGTSFPYLIRIDCGDKSITATFPTAEGRDRLRIDIELAIAKENKTNRLGCFNCIHASDFSDEDFPPGLFICSEIVNQQKLPRVVPVLLDGTVYLTASVEQLLVPNSFYCSFHKPK